MGADPRPLLAPAAPLMAVLDPPCQTFTTHHCGGCRGGAEWAQLWCWELRPYLRPGRSLSHDGSVTAAAPGSRMAPLRERLSRLLSPHRAGGSGESSRLLPQVTPGTPVLASVGSLGWLRVLGLGGAGCFLGTYGCLHPLGSP